MTKKRRSNGFMYFADARRSIYEAENNREGTPQLTARKLVERATRDWKLMSEDERQKWRTESRRRRDEYQRQVHQMQSISIVKKSKIRPLSHLVLSLQPKPPCYRLTESSRKSLRQSIYQKLVWREKEDMTEVLAKKRFGVLTVRSYCTLESSATGEDVCAPGEFCSSVISLNEGIVENSQILVRHDYPSNHQFYQLARQTEHGFSDLSPSCNHLDVHQACLQIANVLRGCWSNLILVPASQYQDLVGSLAWIKEKRDNILKRDTTSVRADRLICLEDMIAVIGHIFETEVDDSSAWESMASANAHLACGLHSKAPSKCPTVVAKTACDHFLTVLGSLINSIKHTKHVYEHGDDSPRRQSPATRTTTRSNRTNPFRQQSRQAINSSSSSQELLSTDFSIQSKFNKTDKMSYVKKWLANVEASQRSEHEHNGV